MAGLLDNYLDPAAAQRAGLFEGLARFGAALAEAGRPRMIMREGYGPGLLGGLAAGFGGFGQGMREGRQNALAQQMQQQGAARELAMQEALGAAPDEQLSAGGRQLRGLLGQMPASARAALPFVGPEQRGAFLAQALRPGERQNVVVSPGGALVNSETGQPVYQAPFAPQRPPQLDPNQRFMLLPDGSIVDKWSLGGGGGGGAPPAAPAMPGSMPPVAPPAMGLPSPNRASSFAPPQAAPGDTVPQPLPARVGPLPPDVAPAGGQPMLTPQPGDVMPVQGAPMAPPASLPPGTVRAAPPPEWQTVTEQNRPMFGLPAPREGAVWQRNSRTGETRQIGGGGVNVNVGTSESVRNRADTDTLKEVQTGANQARAVIALLDRAEQAVRATPEGMGAQLVPVIGQIGKALGFDVPGTSEAEVLRGVTTTLASLQRVPGSGATTDFEMRLYMNAVPRLGTTREGSLQLIQMGRALAERKIAEANIWRRHAGEADLQDRLDALGPVFNQAQRQLLDARGEYEEPMSRRIPGPGGVGTAEPPAAPRPRARNAQGQVIEYDGRAWVPVQ